MQSNIERKHNEGKEKHVTSKEKLMMSIKTIKQVLGMIKGVEIHKQLLKEASTLPLFLFL